MFKMVSIIAPIFLVIILGHFLKKYRLLDEQFVKTGNKLLINVFAPILLFYEIAQSNFSEVFSTLHLLIMLGSIILVFLLSYPLAKLLHLSAPVTATFVSTNFRSNATFIGLPLCYYTLGDEGFTIASILIAFLVPLNNILGILVYSAGDLNNIKMSELRNFAKNTFTNPMIIGCLLGIVFSVLRVPIPEIFNNTLSIISGITMPIALLNIGASISLEYLRGNTKLIMISSMIKLLGLPAIALAVFKLLGIETFGYLEKTVIVLLATPSAQINYLLASIMDGDSDLAISGIVTSTILSAFTLVFWMHIFTYN